ncbi:Hydrolase-4 domain-containing protein [Mycena sanguinolenta]|uniref:Hydrolase-4 domain-containing protein n=1 Tax=Mycena sanguinolenta TaxID=230812 RepID=A0A8H6X4N9_9AGAR|nr:Hydrolase-4 domain-containing protein [Mycena sanguinolenta]
MPASTPYTEAWLTGPQNTRFYTRTYKADTPTAVLVFLHGAAEHAGRYTDMHTSLASQGISVFMFDQRGFGKTALDKEHRSKDSAYGKTDAQCQLDDMEWAIEHVQLEFGGLPIFVMGASMGGGLVLGLMCDEKRASHKAVAAIRGVITGSPCLTLTKAAPRLVLWIVKFMAFFKPYMLYPIRNKPEDLSRDPVTNAQYLADPLIKTPGSLRSILDMLGLGAHILSTSYINWPKDTPVLFLHGTADPVTSCESTKALFEKLQAEDKTMITYPGAYHELHNEPDDVREKCLADVVAFIQLHCR